MKPAYTSRPIPESYWVQPGLLLAGEYPGARDDALAQRKVRRLLAAGVTLFLDLTEPDEYRLKPYWPFVEATQLIGDTQPQHLRLPIRDMGVPAPADMTRILAAIDTALAAQQTMYVHCWGGIGRTGTVIGCYLVQQGMSGEQALTMLAQLRHGTPDSHRSSPETQAQRQFVHDWHHFYKRCATPGG